MIEFITKLRIALFGEPAKPCPHNWKVVKEFEISSQITQFPTGHLYVQQCEHCGELKKTRIDATRY